jgi:hypothetical protein
MKRISEVSLLSASYNWGCTRSMENRGLQQRKWFNQLPNALHWGKQTGTFVSLNQSLMQAK